MPRRSTLRQQAATGDGETCPIADDSSNLAGGGAASVSGEQLECERCGAKDHSGEQCPHFSHRRDQTGDGAQPSAAEIAKNIADGIMPTVVIKAELVVMSGAGLDCFYNFFVAALAKLGLDGAPKSAAALRKRLGSFLRAAANARRVVIGPSAASSCWLLCCRGKAPLLRCLLGSSWAVAARSRARAAPSSAPSRACALASTSSATAGAGGLASTSGKSCSRSVRVMARHTAACMPCFRR